MSGIAPIAPFHLPELKSIEGAPTGAPAATKSADVGGAFGNVLSEARTAESTATDAAERFANGDQSVGIHEVMIASEKSNIALRFATTLKNRAVEAYRELMNTQV